MISLVKVVLERIDCEYEEGMGNNYGLIIVRKI
jgi:hypothetical protein